MGFRFRKSIKIAPGVRINIGKTGVSSLNIGKRGSSVSINSKGTYANLGIPGTGLSYRAKLGGKSTPTVQPAVAISKKPSAVNPPPQITKTMLADMSLNDLGEIEIFDSNGKLLSPELIKLAKKQNRDFINGWLENECQQFNQEVEDMLSIHLTTPPPYMELAPDKPIAPEYKKLGFLSKIFGFNRKKIEAENRQREENYNITLQKWERIIKNIELAKNSDIEAMQNLLEDVLNSIVWPRETLVAFDILNEGKTILLDVDLPEIEDMPQLVASVNARDLKLNIKEKSLTQLQKEYLNHIHAIGFKFIGETFVCLPTIDTIVLSGFSQRLNKKTGHIEDEYLYSIKVKRSQWEQLNFSQIELIDVVQCFENFELRRKLTSKGTMSPIDPFFDDM